MTASIIVSLWGNPGYGGYSHHFYDPELFSVFVVAVVSAFVAVVVGVLFTWLFKLWLLLLLWLLAVSVAAVLLLAAVVIPYVVPYCCSCRSVLLLQPLKLLSFILLFLLLMLHSPQSYGCSC